MTETLLCVYNDKIAPEIIKLIEDIKNSQGWESDFAVNGYIFYTKRIGDPENYFRNDYISVGYKPDSGKVLFSYPTNINLNEWEMNGVYEALVTLHDKKKLSREQQARAQLGRLLT